MSEIAGILERSTLPAALCDLAGVIRSCNVALAGLLSQPPERIRGRRWTDLSPPGRPLSDVEQAFTRAVAGQGPAVEEMWLASAGGAPIRVRWHILPLWTERSGPEGSGVARVQAVLLLGEWIDGLHRLEAEVRFLSQRLDYARRAEAVGRYAGRFAHDFNNLLGGILGFAELAEDNLHRGEDCGEEVGEILQLVARGRTLVRALLETRHRFKPRFEAVDLPALVRAEFGGPTSGVLDGEIRWEFEESLPRVRSDPSLVRLLLFSMVRLLGRFVRGQTVTVRAGQYRGQVNAPEVAGSNWVVLDLTAPEIEPPRWWRDWTEEELWGDVLSPPDAPRAELSAVACVVRDHRGHWSLSREGGTVLAKVFLPADTGD